MKIFAIRHTSVAVEPGICYGQSNVQVADSFKAEKEVVASKIQGIQFDRIYSSPLVRCKVLAESLLREQQITFDDRLKELNFGDWELKTWDDIYFHKEGKIWMDNYQILPTLNGESYPEMVKRVDSFINEIRATEPKTIMIVTHAGVIRILKSIIENLPISELFESFKPEYGSVTEFELKR